jgi:uncharacterized protein (DUF924 family)
MNRVGVPSDAAQTEPAWVGQVLRYWFEELNEAHWFVPDRGVDQQIRDRFLGLHERVAGGEGPEVTSAREVLAAVIVLDQFSRNLFRGTPRAYAADPMARQLAGRALSQGLDVGMTNAQRQFLYMPFQHSEDRQDQVRSLALFEKLGNVSWICYAQAHKSIIDRFGRFPHRNQILGRISSAAELASLNEPMGSF